MQFETVIYEKRDHKAYITLNRPEVLNCFSMKMQGELKEAWADVREDEGVHVVVLTGAGKQAFCSGVDRKDSHRETMRRKFATDFWHTEKPASKITSKQNGVFKPVITAVNGICCGGAFYFLYDSDITICSENATFFDPHVSYGQVTALESMGMTRKVPLGEILRIALVGLDERVSAQRAYQVGLVSEVVPQDKLMEAAERLADIIAGKPPMAVQGTVRAIWYGMDVGRAAALDVGILFPVAQSLTGETDAGQQRFLAKSQRPQWRLR